MTGPAPLRYFHWGACELPVGAVLTSPHARGVRGVNATPAGDAAGYRQDMVYLWDERALAHLDPDQPWGQVLYEVVPIGPVQPDPERAVVSAPFMAYAWIASAARIIAVHARA